MSQIHFQSSQFHSVRILMVRHQQLIQLSAWSFVDISETPIVLQVLIKTFNEVQYFIVNMFKNKHD